MEPKAGERITYLYPSTEVKIQRQCVIVHPPALCLSSWQEQPVKNSRVLETYSKAEFSENILSKNPQHTLHVVQGSCHGTTGLAVTAQKTEMNPTFHRYKFHSAVNLPFLNTSIVQVKVKFIQWDSQAQALKVCLQQQIWTKILGN